MAHRLGKKEYKHDPRTLRMARFLAVPPEIRIARVHDFDKKRAPFPANAWGNNDWGNCVIVTRLEQTLRFERVERRRTLPVRPSDAIEEYKRLSGAISPGDARDEGLVMLYANRDWRNNGWPIPTSKTKNEKTHVHTISAYGELNANDREQLRAAIFLLHGIQLGLWLPLTARTQYRNKQTWDVVPGTAPETVPGTWGGHAVYAKRYDEGGIFVKTWGEEVYCTNAFIEKYCDEVWAVVDNLSIAGRYLDVSKMNQHLRDVGATAIN